MIWGGFWKGFGRVLGGSWEGLGRVLGGSGGFFKGLNKGRRAKRASKASERSSQVLLALALK